MRLLRIILTAFLVSNLGMAVITVIHAGEQPLPDRANWPEPDELPWRMLIFQDTTATGRVTADTFWVMTRETYEAALVGRFEAVQEIRAMEDVMQKILQELRQKETEEP